jgi:anti-sigma factor RsiW
VPKAVAAPPPRSSTPAPDLTGEIERTRAARLQAAAAAEAAQAAELAAHRASAEAEAARAAAEAHVQQNRDELRAAREEDSDERSRQYLVLAAMAWTLLLSGVAIVLLFAKLRRSQSPPKTENPKTEDASAATMTRSSVYSRFSESIAQADAASAAKSHGYQSGGRVRVFFQTRASNPSGNSSALRRVGYAPR